MIAQDHQRMEQKISHLIDDLLTLSSLRSYKDFPGLFCDFFKDLILTGFEELGRVRAWLWRRLASGNNSQHAFEDAAVRLVRRYGT